MYHYYPTYGVRQGKTYHLMHGLLHARNIDTFSFPSVVRTTFLKTLHPVFSWGILTALRRILNKM